MKISNETRVLLLNLKLKIKNRGELNKPITEQWFVKASGNLTLKPDFAVCYCASKGWLSRFSKKQFFPADNLV